MKASRFITAALIAALMAGCEPVGPDSTQEETGEGARVDENGYLDCGAGVYITAVTFEDGYDWQRDTAFGLVSGSIRLYWQEKLILSIPAGPGTEVSLDADKHHFLDGHLYTEYNSISETVIKKDGNEFIRYDGPETIKGIVMRDGDFYSLGQKTGGKGGFSLRKNGLLLMEREAGTLCGSFADPSYGETGALYEDEGIMYFSFYTAFKDDSPSTERHWYLVKNQTVTEVWLEKEVEEFYDMRMICGEFCRLVSLSGIGGPVMDMDGIQVNLVNTIQGNMANDYRLFKFRDRPFMSGRYNFGNESNGRYTGLWTSDGMFGLLDGKLRSICTEGNTAYFISNCNDGSVEILSTSGYRDGIPRGYTVGPPCSAACRGGKIYILLCPTSEYLTPVVWTPSGAREYDINGFLTSVTIL